MMKPKSILLATAIAAAVVPAANAALVWTGAGDGADLFQETNWLDDNGAVPAADTINPGAVVTAATGGLIQIDSGTGTPGSVGGTFQIGDGNDLLVGGGKTLQTTGGNGLRVDGGYSRHQSVSIVNASLVNVQYLVNLGITLNGGATLRLRGGGNPINGGSTVDFQDTASLLLFDNETWSAFESEHINKVTYQGAALVFGSDPYAVEPGDNAVATAYNGTSGVQIQGVPEPSAALLGALGLLGLLRRRKG
jgi:hypothetical protein